MRGAKYNLGRLPPVAEGAARLPRRLRSRLPQFLDGWKEKPRLCIYNAGTDPYVHDRLGGLCLSDGDILERDLFVVEQVAARNIPVVMLLSGGYSKASYRLVAATVAELLRRKNFNHG